MYHTEVYLDRTTYFSKGHIWTKVMQFQNAVCFLWCIYKDENKDELVVEQRLCLWMKEELVSVLGKGTVFIQKALNRLAGGLDRGEVYLYYRGRFYSGSSELQNGMVILENGKGMYGSKSVECIFTEFGMKELREELSQKTTEEEAGLWKKRLLKKMMQEDFEGGYVLFWEEDVYGV